MSTQQTQQTTEKTKKGEAPLLKDGRFSLWKKEFQKECKTATVFSISQFHPKTQDHENYSIFADVGSHQLTAEEALAIAKGDDVSTKIKTPNKGEVDAVLVAGEKITTKNGEHTNTTLHVATVYPKVKDNELISYNVPLPHVKGQKTEYASVYRAVGPREDPVILSAADAAKLVRGEIVYADDIRLKATIENKTVGENVFKNAKVIWEETQKRDNKAVASAPAEEAEEEGVKV